MRLFVGVWLSDAMRGEVVDYINHTRKDNTGFKWTNPDNLHFTLKFLGDVPETRLNELCPALKSAADRNNNFILKLGTTGFFPPGGILRIVWLGVAEGEIGLLKLADSVENCCQEHNFAKADKPFQAHLTIARIKSGASVPKINITERHFESETMVTGFSLIESCLYPAGPVYKTLENFNLCAIER